MSFLMFKDLGENSSKTCSKTFPSFPDKDYRDTAACVCTIMVFENPIENIKGSIDYYDEMLLRFFIRWENIMLMPCTCITYR
jgi:hypothetical protein